MLFVWLQVLVPRVCTVFGVEECLGAFVCQLWYAGGLAESSPLSEPPPRRMYEYQKVEVN